jgi:hypothetical protein
MSHAPTGSLLRDHVQLQVTTESLFSHVVKPSIKFITNEMNTELINYFEFPVQFLVFLPCSLAICMIII